MVVLSASPICNQTASQPVGIPVVDLSEPRANVSRLILKACEEVGFLKVVNHGISERTIDRIESLILEFFSLPMQEKEKAGPPTPLGYGVRDIGFNGDVGELEYLLLHANPNFISQKAKVIYKEDPSFFSKVVNEYADAMRQLSSDILDLLGEALNLKDPEVFSNMIKDTESDSLLRMNHYPAWNNKSNNKSRNNQKSSGSRIGFGEHSDPQIISLLRSNDVEGLQIFTPGQGGDCVWSPVEPDPRAFFVNVGDMLQAMTNGRLISVKHRAMSNSNKARLSMIFFGAPTLQSVISPASDMISKDNPCRYKSFTWAEYKKTMYKLRLSHDRLDLFQSEESEITFRLN